MSGNATANDNWCRYEYGRQRGHIEYCEQARKCENFYLGGGLQWTPEDVAALNGRPAVELNFVMPAVNTSLGHQINNRMDIAFRPRGGAADQKGADLMSKVVKQIADQNSLHWLESQVFSDGMIQQRGYFDVRMDYSRNVFGDVRVSVPDPMDIIPDPDAKSYNPNEWGDVIWTRWLTLDEIETDYGKEARRAAEASGDEDTDFGEENGDETRAKFGAIKGAVWSATFGGHEIKRLRVIDRQVHQSALVLCAIYPTGEIRVAEGISPHRIEALKKQGCYLIKRMHKRVKWIVTTRSATLFDKWSPYDRFTIIPFFPYFRRGRTRGQVDNIISPQEMVNKQASQYLHVINGTANSGFTVEENSLTNMTTEDLADRGAETGIVIEHKQGAQPPKKIEPNQVPSGLDRAIERGTMAIKEISGSSDAMQGLNGAEVSGIAIQSKQFMGQQQLAVPSDNQGHTRKLMADFLLFMVQNFFDSYRVFRITEQDPRTGLPITNQYEINVLQQNEDGSQSYLNDLTLGDYDAVISDQPMQQTFETGQFQQALELRKAEVAIPDYVVVKHSNLSEKEEIIRNMQDQQSKADPLTEAKVALVNAQTRKTANESVNKAVEALFSATQAANQIAMNPAIAPMADQMLQSAGFEDQDAGPILPQGQDVSAGGMDLPENTSPLTPTNPAVGINAGIEGGAIDHQAQ